MDRLKAFTRNVRTSTTVILMVCITATVGLSIASVIVPHMGVIDPSVLKFASWLFAFASLATLREAIREGIGAKLTHGNTTIEIKDTNGKEPEQEDRHGRQREKEERPC